MAVKKINIGKLLMDSLTKDQIVSLLDIVASSEILSNNKENFKKTDPDMAATIAEILSSLSTGEEIQSNKAFASDQRTLEYWESLWSRWDEIVDDVGDEDGKYVIQDYHWESPYFDGSYLAENLEPIAEKMFGLIDNIHNLVESPDLFLEALEEIEGNISEYPDWMGIEHGDPFGLEKNVTLCLLKWLWLNHQNEKHPGIVMLEDICDIEESHQYFYLNDNACIEFFKKLPEDVCREIYTYLKNEEHEIDLSYIHSKWHTINLDYESQFDTAKYLETCRMHLADNWRYGHPLIEDVLGRDEFKEAELLLEKTFASFLIIKEQPVWNPETLLPITLHYYYYEDYGNEIADLLNVWSDVSGKLGNKKRAGAAKLQSVIFRKPQDCDAVINEYKRLISPKVKNTIDPLFDQWKTEVAKLCFPDYRKVPEVSDTWLHWLVDAELDPKTGKNWFLQKLNKWLSGLKKTGKVFKEQWPLLSLLTKDLSDSNKLKKKYPTFYKTVLRKAKDDENLLVTFRRRGLQTMNAGSCLELIMDVWKEHLFHIVRDPANTYKSEYTEHADWAKALYELNQEAYADLMIVWRSKHSGRRNLWRDLKTAGLSLD